MNISKLKLYWRLSKLTGKEKGDLIFPKIKVYFYSQESGRDLVKALKEVSSQFDIRFSLNLEKIREEIKNEEENKELGFYNDKNYVSKLNYLLNKKLININDNTAIDKYIISTEEKSYIRHKGDSVIFPNRLSKLKLNIWDNIILRPKNKIDYKKFKEELNEFILGMNKKDSLIFLKKEFLRIAQSAQHEKKFYTARILNRKYFNASEAIEIISSLLILEQEKKLKIEDFCCIESVGELIRDIEITTQPLYLLSSLKQNNEVFRVTLSDEERGIGFLEIKNYPPIKFEGLRFKLIDYFYNNKDKGWKSYSQIKEKIPYSTDSIKKAIKFINDRVQKDTNNRHIEIIKSKQLGKKKNSPKTFQSKY